MTDKSNAEVVNEYQGFNKDPETADTVVKKLKGVLKEMEHDLEFNRQSMSADYPYVKIVEILKILTTTEK